MFHPCVIDAPDLRMTFLMGTTKNSSQILSYLYNSYNETWFNITAKKSWPFRGPAKYSCAILHSDEILVSVLSKNGILCMGHYNLLSFTWKFWTNTDQLINVDQISNVKLLRSEKKEFATLLVNSKAANLTFIYQVKMSLSIHLHSRWFGTGVLIIGGSVH